MCGTETYINLEINIKLEPIEQFILFEQFI